LIILRDNSCQLQRLRKVLDSFTPATGLEINFHKSTFVPIHVPPAHATELSSILGSTSLVSCRCQLWSSLSQRISGKILSWLTSLVPIGGRGSSHFRKAFSLEWTDPSTVRYGKPRHLVLRVIVRFLGPLYWLRSEGGIGVVDYSLQNAFLLLKLPHGLFSRKTHPERVGFARAT
jgi:hypothetical protein